MGVLDRLARCDCCDRLPDTDPFYFDLKRQKVMLLTYVPSYQAVHRQLASTRFFRQVFLALGGPSPKLGASSPSEVFLNSIYWTHYHKCYMPRIEGNPVPDVGEVSSRCFDKYIHNEIGELDPRLIVVLGKPLVKKLFRIDLNPGDCLETTLFGIQTICADFPKGAEPELQTVREKLKEHLPWVDTSSIPKAMESPSSGDKETLAVHAKFELRGLRAFLENILCPSQNLSMDPQSIDGVFIQRMVAPRWERYAFIMACFSFLEDQLRPLLAANPDMAEAKRGGRATLERLLVQLASKAGLSHLVSENYRRDIQTLRMVRNCIVHGGGRPPKRSDTYLHRVRGLLFEPSGVVVITDDFCKKAMGIAEDFVRILVQLPGTL